MPLRWRRKFEVGIEYRRRRKGEKLSAEDPG
jgi:hypothetical protein